ncbi:MAG TPA: hypothetical protein VLA53_06175 [Nitrosopumilaceae archaeon]|nr:hypothetical protein [Nitrosopumilaceae archaeon]
MADSETFGIEKGYGQQAVEFMNQEAKKEGWDFEARLYNYEIETKNFGPFEMFSWMGNVKAARDLVIRASKRFKIKVIEGAYKSKLILLRREKTEYALVRKGDRTIGHLEFSAPRIKNSKWIVKLEERR